MLLLTTLCISVFSKSLHSLFSNTAPLRLSLSHWSQTQYRVSLKVMWSPKSSRLVASKVVGRKKREEAVYVTRGAFGNVWGMLSVCHNDWGECLRWTPETKNSPPQNVINTHLWNTQGITENFSYSSQINPVVGSTAWTFSSALDFEPEENLTQESSYINPKSLAPANLLNYFF